MIWRNLALLRSKTTLTQLVFAVLIIGIAFSLRMVLLPPTGRVIYSTFYPAIALIALMCGFRVAIIGMLFAGALAYLFLLPPIKSAKDIKFGGGDRLGHLLYCRHNHLLCIKGG